MTTVQKARRYVAEIDLPAGPKRGPGAPEVIDLPFDTGKTQTTIVGSEVASFAAGVDSKWRQDVVNSSLLAQLAAKKQVPDAKIISQWYDAYFDVLTNVGWSVGAREFLEHKEASANFEAHEAILKVAAAVLGPVPTALAIVTTTLEAMRSMDAKSPWMTIFNRETESARASRFQISVAEQDGDECTISLMAFGLEAKSAITQVLFFKAKSSEATLRYYSNRASIDPDVLEGIRAQLKAKLVVYAQDYLSMLPIKRV